jgi:poly(3-hydroxyalkanoate) synthetase
MINPMQLIQMMRSGNPKQIAMQMVNSNPQIANNPMIKNMFSMAEKNDIQGITQLGKNMAKEKGIDFDKSFSDFKSQFLR